MLTENHIKEGLSRAYILAVAHRAGFDCSFGTGFDYGIDGAIHEIAARPSGRYRKTGFIVEFQAKASHNCSVSATEVSYVLSAKNHDDLIETDVGTPRILIVLALPPDAGQWLKTSPDELVMKRCAWWCSLRGRPPTQNATVQTIKIPIGQTFDVGTLTAMMSRVKKGGLP